MPGRPTKGTVWAVDTGASAAFVDLAEIKSYTGPKAAVSNVDITSITQTSNYKQSTPGTIDGGNISLELYWTAAGHAAVLAILGNAHGFRLAVGNVTYTWSGYVDEIGEISGGGPDDPLTFKVQVKVLSEVTPGTLS